MSTAALMSVEEYLETSFDDGDREFIDGELLERNPGEISHSDVQTLPSAGFVAKRRVPGVYPLVEVRVRVSPTRYRVPDVTVVRGEKPSGRIVTEPPFLVIEILSPEDRASRTEEKIDDYIRVGVRFVWVIDPETGKGHIYTQDRRIAVEGGVFRTEDPWIEVQFAELAA